MHTENYKHKFIYDNRAIVYENGQVFNVVRGCFVNPWLCSNGYFTLDLNFGEEKVKRTLHTLLADCFVWKPEGTTCVNHKDGVKTHNNLDNLEWVTHTESMRHAIKLGIIPKKRSWRRLYIEQYSMYGDFIARYNGYRDASKAVSSKKHAGNNIRNACADFNLSAYGYRWKRVQKSQETKDKEYQEFLEKRKKIVDQ